MALDVFASVFLLSYNKREYVLEAIESVMNQTFGLWELNILENSTDQTTRHLLRESGYLRDLRIIYEEINFTDEDRKKAYIPAVLLNNYYPRATGEFIFYLSDDDLLDPNCLSVCMEHFAGHPDHSVAYFGMTRVGVRKPRALPAEKIKCSLSPVPRDVLGPGQAVSKLDGGQVAHRKSVLDNIERPFFPEELNEHTHLADGHFIEKLAAKYQLHPIPYFLLEHRYTPLSIWQRLSF